MSDSGQEPEENGQDALDLQWARDRARTGWLLLAISPAYCIATLIWKALPVANSNANGRQEGDGLFLFYIVSLVAISLSLYQALRAWKVREAVVLLVLDSVLLVVFLALIVLSL